MADTETSSQQVTSEPVNISGSRNDTAIVDDPFAAQRERRLGDNLAALGTSPGSPGTSPKQDRRLSKEWDASKVPPSRFQKREGSIYATPGSRDGHVGKNTNTAFTEKLREKASWRNHTT
ncbi:MAG: hypothetical protein M1840_001109 [Geoglossum simile]|nr:MAG: hypothetical protein M1840_001109 [Geoglossum simile]